MLKDVHEVSTLSVTNYTLYRKNNSKFVINLNTVKNTFPFQAGAYIFIEMDTYAE